MCHGVLQLTRHTFQATCRPGILRTPFRRSASVGLKRRWSTPLAKTIADAIEVTGPISIAAYMRQCLTSDQGGYYTTTRNSDTGSLRLPNGSMERSTDQFGKHGDFITSPEISQIFGELVGIWFMTEWLAQGRKSSGVQFIEVGPGRGTLMDDMLRTIMQFKTFAQSVDGIWLVEAGPSLRERQKNLLCGESAVFKELSGKVGWESPSKYSNIPIRWVEDISLLPPNDESTSTSFIIAHEFFDALPIHSFESIAPSPEVSLDSKNLRQSGVSGVKASTASKTPQWRELLVMPSKWNPISTMKDNSTDNAGLQPDFQLTIAKASTPTSLVLPEQPRYRHLKSQVGSRIEISPESARYIRDFSQRIGGPKSGSPSGAALIIDYGPADTIPTNSLRGIKSHQVISPFISPGQADISADVDFIALADTALEAHDSVEVHGPTEQGQWLHQLGIKERAEQLLSAVKQDERKSDIQAGWQRLVEGGPRGMGKAYKVMAIVPYSGGRRRPVGFGGNVINS